jgi:GNAT superfamily N-acetyltransferase
MEITIRPAKIQDLAAIIEIQTQAISNLPDRFRKYDRQQIESLVAGQVALRKTYFRDETTLVAENQDRKPIGFISWSQPLFFQPSITGLFVHPSFMNRGVGGKLIEELDVLAIERRVRKLWVMASLESVDFYKLHGYQFKREIGFFSQGSAWIPCELLEKEFMPSTPVQSVATQTFKLVLSVIFLAIISRMTYKEKQKQICCPAKICHVCPQTNLPSGELP